MRFFSIFIFSAFLLSSQAFCYSANMVWFEFMADGRYKVVVGYTVPELKEFREDYVIFSSKSKADSFYWALVRGADFYPSDPRNLRFNQTKREPSPW